MTAPPLSSQVIQTMLESSKAQGHPAVEFLTITPDEAGRLLSDHENYRRVREGRVDQYVEDMKAGDWQSNGASVVIDVNGNLADGQHRLLGVMLAGIPLETVVVVGVEPEAVDVIDGNLVRSASDALRRAGVPNYNHVASAARLDTKTQGGARHTNISIPAILAWYRANPDITYALTRTGPTSQPPLRVSMGASGLFYMWARRIDTESADAFLDAVITGALLDTDDPRLALRSWVMGRSNPGHGVQKPGPHVFLHVFAKSWNLWVTGRQLRVMKWKPTDEFPVILNADGEDAHPREIAPVDPPVKDQADEA